ncbi:MAG: hypothetical protein ACM3YO_03065, partial [Bacteroidota bacterium]
MMTWLETLSLERFEASWTEAWGNSGLGRMIEGFTRRVEGFLTPHLATSLLARASSGLSLASVCLALFLSPFVGTGLNAVLVLLAFFLMLFDRLVNPPTETKRPPLFIPLFLLIGFTMVAVGASPYPVASLKGAAKLVIYWLAFATFLGNL